MFYFRLNETKDDHYHFCIGIPYLFMQRYDLAFNAFKKAIELNPNEPKYHEKLQYTKRKINEKKQFNHLNLNK